MRKATKMFGPATAVLATLALLAVVPASRAQQAAQSQTPTPLPDATVRSFFPEGTDGWLGVSVEEVSPDKAKELKMPAAYGVFVSGVSENTPAAKAGIKKDDVIIGYNDQRVEGAAEFRRLVRETPPGHTAKLQVWRDGRTEKLSAEVGHPPEPPANAFFGRTPPPLPHGFSNRPQSPLLPGAMYGNRLFASTPALGVSAIDLTQQLGAFFGAPNGEGVLITDVHQGSAGEKAGLKAGDVITKVNGEHVRNLGELRERLRNARDAKSVTLTIIRRGMEIAIIAEPELPHPTSLPDPDRRIPL